MMIYENDSIIEHYGQPRRSGRYPWGSGGELLETIDRLSSKGFTEKEIADGLGISTKVLRNQKTLAVGEKKEAERLNVTRQRDNGMSVAAISREFKIPESTVRDLLKPAANAKYRLVRKIADILSNAVKKFGIVDIGDGVEQYLGVSKTKLDNAVALLQNEGYEVHKFSVQQLGTNNKTTVKVLVAPGVDYKTAIGMKSKIAIPNYRLNDSGEDFITPPPINNISSKKVKVVYNSGSDGLIEVRAGVPELSLGGKSYAQGRIGVDGSHYLKGMIVASKTLPDGVDILYHTGKKSTGDDFDVFKKQEVEGPTKFGAITVAKTYVDSEGNRVAGHINVVGSKTLNEEGAWSGWTDSLASQVISKQPPRIAQKQLNITYDNFRAELDEIKTITHPVVKKHLLGQFADTVDKSARDLQAAALPRQTTNVLLPDPTLDPTHIYAPNYKDGETVSLIRYPHAGRFEIPTLVVNNKTSKYRKMFDESPRDAVAIHPDVAAILSGADFDGDTVLVIPNKKGPKGLLKTSPALEGLKNFDSKEAYPYYEGMTVMTKSQTQRLMGDVSNLITDMTIKGASDSEITRAVRHSMVVIDAEKHKLNYKQSYLDNGIASLKEKYQGGSRSGASTLISKARSEERVPHRRDHYDIDPKTGEKVYTETGEYYYDKKGNQVQRTTKSYKMDETKDAYDLSSGTVIEGIYANHANKLKGLANEARLTLVRTEDKPYNRAARETYKTEVETLEAKLRLAVRSRPIERKAQILAGEIYKSKLDANPGLSRADKKKERGKALILARRRLKAKRPTIEITPREWEAIELGAVSSTRLTDILRNADMDVVRSYATPRVGRTGLSPAKLNRARLLLKAGYTASEVAVAVGGTQAQIINIEKGD